MYFPDLGNVTQIARGDHVRAVGWLTSSQNFPQGEVTSVFVSQLRILCERWGEGREALCWPFAIGFHECELCHAFWASGNLGVPAGDILYVAPQMISHYVESHGYVPPAVFVDAVLRSPLPGTDDYLRSVAHFRELHYAFWTANFREP